MITKEELKSLLETHTELVNELDKISDTLNICIYENKAVDAALKIFDKALKVIFNDEGLDTLYWWLYEKKENPDLKMWCDGEELPTETIDDIWELIEDCRK